MALGTKCSFVCAVNTYINEAKTHCVGSCTKLSSDLKSCVANCVTGFVFFNSNIL